MIWQQRLNLPTNILLHFIVQQMAVEGQFDTMAADMEACVKQRGKTEFLCVEKIALIDIHQHLLNFYGDYSVDVSTVKRWVVHLSSGDSNGGSLPMVQVVMSMACRFLYFTGENA